MVKDGSFTYEGQSNGWRSRSAIASGAPADGCTPMFETNLAETLGIRKFLEMSMADLRDQVAKAGKDPKVHVKQFKMIKAHATILTAWMVSALEMVDSMLAEAKARSETSLAEQKRRFTGC